MVQTEQTEMPGARLRAWHLVSLIQGAFSRNQNYTQWQLPLTGMPIYTTIDQHYPGRQGLFCLSSTTSSSRTSSMESYSSRALS